MAALSDAELYALTQRYFGDLGPEVVNTMFQIAKRESGGNPSAYNGTGNDRSYGIWQINTIQGANPDMLKYDLFDPEQNARAAREIYNRQGPQAWSTYGATASASKATSMNLTPQQITNLKAKIALEFGSNEGGQLRPLDTNSIVITPAGEIVVLGPNGQPSMQLWAVANPDGSLGYTFDQPEKPDPAKTPNIQTSSLPTGYTFNPQTGQFYRNGQPVSAEEVQAAARAEAMMGKSAPQNEFQISPKTGDLVMIDPVTGQMRTVQSGFGYPEVSPWQQRQDQMFGIQESARQADNGFTANVYGTQESGRQADNSLAVQLYGIQDSGAIERARLGQKDVIDRATLMEQARQSNLEAALRQFEARARLIPEFGQLALAESDAQRQILSQGGDFLYRAFRSQGEESPLPLVTQADLMAHLRDQLAQLNNIIPAEALDSGTTRIDGFSIPAAAAAPTPTPMAPAPTPKPYEQPKLMGQTTTFTPTTAASGAQIYVPDGVPDWVKSGLVSQYAEGTKYGFTVEPQFITGDPKPGKPSSPNPEMIYNPTNAPISVVPMDKMNGFSLPSSIQQNVQNVRQAVQGRMQATDQMRQRLQTWLNMMRSRGMTGFGFPRTMPAFATGTTAQGNAYEMTGNANWDRDLALLADTNAGIAAQQAAYRGPSTQPAASAPAAAAATTYSAPAQTYRYPTTQPTPLPDYFQGKTPTQEELIAAADRTLPPAIRAVMQGGAPQQRGFDFNLPTLRQLSMLTDEELKAFDTYTRVKYQTPLADTYREIQQRYAPTAAGFTARPSFLLGPGV